MPSFIQLMFTKQLLRALFQLLGIELWSKTHFPLWWVLSLMGESDVKYMNDTNKYRIALVGSANCTWGLSTALAQDKWEVTLLMISLRFRLLNISSYGLITMLKRFPWICTVLTLKICCLWGSFCLGTERMFRWIFCPGIAKAQCLPRLLGTGLLGETPPILSVSQCWPVLSGPGGVDRCWSLLWRGN